MCFRVSAIAREIHTPADSMLYGTYDYRLVALSVALAIFASYAALDIAGRVTSARNGWRTFWLISGATSIGLGMWAMHMVGVRAFALPVPVLYHYPTLMVSLMAAVAASGVALFTASRERMGALSWTLGSVVMGAGIVAMHHTGMMAMRLPATMEYRPNLVRVSILLAFVTSFGALRLAFRVRSENKSTRDKVISAVIMGTALPLAHYTDLWAIRFHASPVPFTTDRTVSISPVGLALISIAICLLMTLTFIAAFVDRLLDAQRAVRDAARSGEEQFRTLAEAIPQIVWTAGPDGLTNYINHRWYEMTGMTPPAGLGSAWMETIHPDDRDLCAEKWQQCLRSGSTFEIEYRLLDASHGYRWYLDRAIPLRDSGGAIQQWFGTCTDIEEQKHNQQILEHLIHERTEELASANAKLHEEMRAKDLVRHDFDQRNEATMRDLTDRSHRATLLARMGQLLQSCMTREEALAAALGFAPQIFPTRRGAVMLLNDAGNVAEVMGSWNDCELRIFAFDPSGCWALRTGQPHIVLQGDTSAPCGHAASVTHSYLCVPILAQGQTIGILHVQATDEAPHLQDAEVSFKATFAGQLGLSIANIRLRDALRSQSIRDVLTGLYNRRYLEESLEREIRRAVRAAQPLGILMLDLDHFKRCNDTYGHDAGDTILRETAGLLTRSIRAEDVVCRYGGEEFVIILPTADLNAACMRGERIRSKLRQLAVAHNGQSLGMITVSVGVAALPEHGTSTHELLAAADAALYQAKREGRDRVVAAASRPAAGEVNVALAD
ncbi:MAG: diguanylate cyclase [Candidatus Sulfotelmatobacter sp.]